MRRLLITAVTVGVTAAVTAPTVAGSLVTASGQQNDGICVTVMNKVTKCTDFPHPGLAVHASTR